MRSTSRSRGDSSLQTGEIETQTTNVGPIAIRETTSHNPQTDQYESRTESSIIEFIQDENSIMTTLATRGISTSTLYTNPTTQSKEEEKRTTAIKTYEDLTSIKSTTPEVVLVSNFQPLFKSMTTAAAFNKKPLMTPAGHHFDMQISTRMLKFVTAKKIVTNNREYSTKISRFTHQRKTDFELALSSLKKTSNFMLASSQMIERLKIKLDVKDQGYVTNPVDAYKKHLSQYSSIRSQSLLQHLNDFVYTNLLPSFGIVDILQQFGYVENNVRNNWLSTKAWLQLLLEFKHILTFRSSNVINSFSQKQDDDNKTRLEHESPVVQNQNYVNSLKTMKEYGDLADEQFDEVHRLFMNLFNDIDDSINVTDIETKIAVLLLDITRECRYSSSLNKQKCIDFLKERYGISVSNIDNSDIFERVVGKIGDNIYSVDTNQKNSLASLSVTSADQQSVLALEPFFASQQTNFTAGGDYYADSVTLINDSKFDVSRLESLSSKIHDIETSFNGITNHMNIMSADYLDENSYESGALTSKISNSNALFDEIKSLFFGDDEKPRQNVRDDIISSVFSLAESNDSIKSVLFLYLTSKLSGNNSTFLVQTLVDQIFNEARLIDRNRAMNNDILRFNDQSRERERLQSVSKNELIDAFMRPGEVLNQVGTFLQKYNEALQQSGVSKPTNHTRFSNQSVTLLFMKLFSVIVSVFAKSSGKSIVGYVQRDNNEFVSINNRTINNFSYIRAISDKLRAETALISHVTLHLFTTLSMMKKTVNDTSSFFSAPTSSTELKKLTTQAGSTVTQLLFDENQVRTISSVIDDLQSSISKSDNKNEYDVDSDGDFDIDDQVRILDDSVISSKMKNTLYGIFSSDEYALGENSSSKIFSIGIPSGLLDDLRKNTNVQSVKNVGYSTKQSDLIHINVHKIDQRNPDIVWKAQRFLFEMSRYPVRNNRLINSSNNKSDLISYLSGIPTRDYSAHESTRVQYFSSSDNTQNFSLDTSYDFLKNVEKYDLYRNHTMSYMFELYLKIMTGLSTAEHEFTIADQKTVIDTQFVSDILTSELNRQTSTRGSRESSSAQGERGTLFRRSRRNREIDGSDTGSYRNDPVVQQTSRLPETQQFSDQFKPLSVIMPEISQNDESMVFFRTASIHELSRMITPQSNPVHLSRRLLTPKTFDRIFNVFVDPSRFEIDVIKTTMTSHGKNAFDSLIKNGEIVANKNQTVERRGSRHENQLREYSSIHQYRTGGELVFDKYVITVDLHGTGEQ